MQMRIIAVLLSTAATVLLLGQTAYCQMLYPGQIQAQKYNNCIIYHLRKLDSYASNADLKDICSSPKGWSPTLHDPIFKAPAVSAFYNAEKAYCDKEGCSTVGKDMRLVLVGDLLPHASISTNKAVGPKDVDAVNLVVTTTLMDFVQKTTHVLLNDLSEDPKFASQGFKAWIGRLRALGGKCCILNVRWNFSGEMPPEMTMDNLLRATMTSYQIIFAHELAHLRFNQNCGYRTNSSITSEMNALGVEKACDKIALEQLTKAGIGMPFFAVGTFMSWQHYVTLRKPRLMSEFPGGPTKFKETFPALNLKERAQALVDIWESACRGGLKAPMCTFWENNVTEAKKIINMQAPVECIP
jgi:hypothetical protein